MSRLPLSIASLCLLIFASPCLGGDSEDWKSTIQNEAPPEMQVRAFLESGMDELGRDPDGIDKALLRVEIILDQWESEPPPPEADTTGDGAIHTARSIRENLVGDFFSQARFFGLLHRLQDLDALPAGMLDRARPVAEASLRPMERGPNNRSYLFALGHIYAAKLFPDNPQAAMWEKYAQAVWNDFYEPGDTYEPGYVAHNLPPAIDLGIMLGKQEELTGPHLRPVFERFRRNVSPSGLVIDPGDGANQSAYPEWLSKYAALSRDGSFLWALEQTIAAGQAGGYRGEAHPRPSASEIEPLRRHLVDPLLENGITSIVPDCTSSVESTFPRSFDIADRLILNASRKPGYPFAAFYLNDTAETLHHAHEDNRGELYHYEVDGSMLLKRASWQKWAGQTNTFVVADARAEFPFPENPRPAMGHWFRADANLRPIRLNQEDERWKRVGSADQIPPLSVKLTDSIDDLGYRWDNENGFGGVHDVLDLQSVTLSFNTFLSPESGAAGQPASFPESIRWYRDYRPIAPAEGPVTVRVANLRLMGPDGDEVLDPLNALAENWEIRFYPADNGTAENDAARIIPRDQWSEFLRVVDDEKMGACIEIVCPPGRLDLRLSEVGKKFNVTEKYPRIGFDYAYQSGAEEFLRPPIAVLLNDLRFRSLYIDHQQGGMLTHADANVRDGDAYGTMRYEGVWTARSNWTRQSVLTREGILVVFDVFEPGPETDGMVGGPVWQLPPNPRRGSNWFASEVDPHAGRGVLIWMQGGDDFGLQRQSKLWRLEEAAVFARKRLSPNTPTGFVSVMLPYGSSETVETVADRILDYELDADSVQLTIARPDPSEPTPIVIRLDKDGWEVRR